MIWDDLSPDDRSELIDALRETIEESGKVDVMDLDEQAINEIGDGLKTELRAAKEILG